VSISALPNSSKKGRSGQLDPKYIHMIITR
jgi:hypothetical protein